MPGWVSNGASGQEFEFPEEACKAVAKNAGGSWSYSGISQINGSTSYYCNLYNPNNAPSISVYAIIKQALCPGDPRWVTSYHDNKTRYCKMFEINIYGPSETNTLPSVNGPIAQTIKVTSIDGFEKNVNVILRTKIGQTVAGYTNDDGEISFIFVPPEFIGAKIDVAASCSHCEGTVSKTIIVWPAQLKK